MAGPCQQVPERAGPGEASRPGEEEQRKMKWERVLIGLVLLNACTNAYLLFALSGHPDLRAGTDVFPVLYQGIRDDNRSIVLPGGDPGYIDEKQYLTPSPEDPATGTNETPEGDPGNAAPAVTPLPPATPHAPTLPAIPPANTSAITLVPTPSDGWITYTSPNYGFSLRYPSTWQVSERPAGIPRGILQLTPPAENVCDRTGLKCFKYLANLTIEVDQRPFTLAPDEYFVDAVAALQVKHSITSTSNSAPCIVSGTRAYQIEFFTRDARGNPERSGMNYYLIIDGKAYIISYTGPYSSWDNVYSNNKRDALRIIDSLTFTRDYIQG